MTTGEARGLAESAAHAQEATPSISVIVPVFNGEATLQRCLDALGRTMVLNATWECIVVDDGSTDNSADIARAWGAHVVRTGRVPSGPAHARTRGAAEARAPLLCFVDADVLVRPTTLDHFVKLFRADPDLVAAFGSYDAMPSAPGVLSQYRNLLHHFVHQNGQEKASTFWAGCGAIRRNVFLEVGGFDPRYTRPSIEDIDLGYRLHTSGAQIRLAKHIQVTHLKRWGLWDIIRTDVRDRALPWSALIARTGYLPNDLNLDWASRVSAVSVYALGSLLVLGVWQTIAWPLAALPLALLLACNRRLYAFFLRERGLWFLVRILPLHWLYLVYSAAVFAGCTLIGPMMRQRETRAREYVPATGRGVPFENPRS
jgi:glycosyltransferase involved in cell wall biosynthesis